MSDPLRADLPRALDGMSIPERDAKIEELLLSGLDRHFAGEYDQAINVWTRILFLDRGHARARAYIDRARSAVAERQREQEALLQRGIEAFNRGETGEARRMLRAAVADGAPPDEALVVLDRLDRLELGSAAQAPSPAAPRQPVAHILQEAERRRFSPGVWLAIGAAAVAAVFLLAMIVPALRANRHPSRAGASPAAATHATTRPPAAGVGEAARP